MVGGTYLDETTPNTLIDTAEVGGTYLNSDPNFKEVDLFQNITPEQVSKAINDYAQNFYDELTYFTEYLSYSFGLGDSTMIPEKAIATMVLTIVCIDLAREGLLAGNLEYSLESTSIIALILALYLHGKNVSSN